MNTYLVTTIYCLLIVLLIIAIIGGIRLIITLKKVDEVIEDVQIKVRSLDKIFEIIDFATNKMSMLSEIIISFINGGLKKILNKNKKSKKEEKENE